jgi:rhodanese-related sulfurtransferase
MRVSRRFYRGAFFWEGFMVRVRLCVLAVLASFFLVPMEAASADGEFPLRPKYPQVRTISTEQFAKMLPDVLVVDSRTRFEWETLHVKGAINVPVDEVDTGMNREFEKGIAKVQQKNTKPIVFYCNGHTCPKSYEAARRAARIGITNVYAYDAGIADWSRVHPELTALYNKPAITLADLIDEKDFNAHLLPAKQFKARALSDKCGCIVVDVRDVVARDFLLFPLHELHVSLDERAALDTVIDKAKREHKTVLAYDSVGKAVQWLQYYLVKRGLKDYLFMKDGENGYVATL